MNKKSQISPVGVIGINQLGQNISSAIVSKDFFSKIIGYLALIAILVMAIYAAYIMSTLGVLK